MSILSLLSIENIKKSAVAIAVYGPGAFLKAFRQTLSINKNDAIDAQTLYKRWIKKYEPKVADLAKQRLQRTPHSTTISIILHSTEADAAIMEATILSVVSQTYPNWELFVVCTGSSAKIIKAMCTYVTNDDRITVSINSVICSVKAASGEFIAFLSQGDILAPFALYEVAGVLNSNPGASIVYSDEDKLDDKAQRQNPVFKPDWSPDYFLSCNYINRFATVRSNIVKGVCLDVADGAFSEYDLLLRATEQAGGILHIPKVLCHSRETTETGSALRQCMEERAAIAVALKRRGVKAEVLDTAFKGYYMVRYEITRPGKVSIVIPTRDNAVLLKKCVDSVLEKSTYKDYEVIIVNNGSGEPETFKYFATVVKDPRVNVIEYEASFNYSAINNYATKRCSGDYIVFLNNDTEIITPGWMEAMMELAQRSSTGVVGAKLLFHNGAIQHAGVIIGIGGTAGHSHRLFPADEPGYGGRIISIQNLSAVTGACMMVRKEAFELVGGFDERFSVTFNDLDLCAKIIEQGYLVVYTPVAELYHHECYTRGNELGYAKQKRAKTEACLFRKKWRHQFANGDPFYNPNLTVTKEDFSIRT